MRKEEIQLLIDRYEEGLTSNAEEKKLRQYFISQPASSMPQEWQAYKALFAFIENEQHPKSLPPTKKSRTIIYRLTGAAAAAACIAAAIIIKMPAPGSTNYAVINGETTTDRNKIAAEAEAALQAVAYTDCDTFGALEGI